VTTFARNPLGVKGLSRLAMREMGNQIEVEPAGRASGGLDLPGNVFAADLTSQVMFPVDLICQVMVSPPT